MASRLFTPVRLRGLTLPNGGLIWGWGQAALEASILEPRHGQFLRPHGGPMGAGCLRGYCSRRESETA